MTTNLLATITTLSDAELLARVRLLAQRERQATAELVAHLAVLDTRQVLLAEGYSSLFTYCTSALGLSEHAAYNRIEAARAIRRFPLILDFLASASVNVTTIRLLAPHLTPENHGAVLAEAVGRCKRDVEALVARLSPRPDVPTTIRKLPAPPTANPGPSTRSSAAALPGPSRAPAESSSAEMTLSAWTTGSDDATPSVLGAKVLPDPPTLTPGSTRPDGMAQPLPRPDRAVLAIIAPERFRLQLTMGAETHSKLRRLQDLLRREVPDGDPVAILDRALSMLLDHVEKKKLAATTNPQPGRVTAEGSRHIPAEVRRAVSARDAGQCAFVSASGRRCAERSFLEFHHVQPFAHGGPSTVDNIFLRCRRHNAYESTLVFGPFDASAVREAPAVNGDELIPERVATSG